MLASCSSPVGCASARLRYGGASSAARPGAMCAPRTQRAGIIAAPSPAAHARRMIVRVSGAAVGAGTKTPWWEKGTTSNMKEVKSVQQLVDELANAGDKLVIVEFYAPWCNACRALYPKVCQIMDEHLEDIIFLKVSFEDNKEMCKMLGIRVLPFFQFFHGAQGKVDEFSCSISKLPRLKEAVALHSAAICSLWPRRQAAWLDEFPEVLPSAAEPFAYADRLTTLAYKDD